MQYEVLRSATFTCMRTSKNAINTLTGEQKHHNRPSHLANKERRMDSLSRSRLRLIRTNSCTSLSGAALRADARTRTGCVDWSTGGVLSWSESSCTCGVRDTKIHVQGNTAGKLPGGVFDFSSVKRWPRGGYRVPAAYSNKTVLLSLFVPFP